MRARGGRVCIVSVLPACLRHAQQCLCLREPVRAALASYSIGAPAMFVSHVSAMPLRMRARGGRVCIVSVLPACLTGMFRSSPAMPLLGRASAGRACIVSDWCSCHVCQPCFRNAFAHASSWWPCVHRIGAPGMPLPGMFRSSPAMPLLARASAGRACIVSDWCSCHVCQPCFRNAFAHASSWWPCVHRIGAPGMFTKHV